MKVENSKVDLEKSDKQAKRNKILLEVAYDGTDFKGWQVQPGVISVQSVLEDKLSKLFAGAKIKAESSGRTDAGVHALRQPVSFLPPPIPVIPHEKIFKALNRMLPDSIRIMSVQEMPHDFHARFSAQSKAYAYLINTGNNTPFVSRWTWHLPSFTKICEVRKAVKFLIGTHDFSSFTVERKEIDSAVRTIYKISVKKFGDIVCIVFIGDGFLYKMVRSMVGSLAFVGTGAIEPAEIARILEAKDRRECYDTAPSKGLFLLKVFYTQNGWKNFSLKDLPFHALS